MKKFLIALNIVIWSFVGFQTTAFAVKETPKTPVTAPAEVKKDETPKTKKVCIKTTDAKTQKEVEKCRTVKIHEKHEGTKMSDAKKDSKQETSKK